MKPASLHRLTRARRHRQDIEAFNALIADPASGSVTLPANGRFAFVATVDAAVDTPIAELVGPSTVNLVSPGMTAEQYITLDYAEKDTVVNVSTGFDMHVIDEFGRHHKICGGV